MSRALPRHDEYAAHRCSCGHLCPWHEGGRCTAGDHTRACPCDAFDGPCDDAEGVA